jgi:hypothetical protein
MENYKKETAVNNRQNEINSLKINTTITNNLQEIPNNFTVCPYTVAASVISKIKKITVILRIS